MLNKIQGLTLLSMVSSPHHIALLEFQMVQSPVVSPKPKERCNVWDHEVESREALCCRGSATTGNSSVFVPEGTTRDEARRPVLMLLIGNKCQSVSAVVLAKLTISSGCTVPSPRDLPPLETDYWRLASRGRCDGAMDNWTLHCFTGPGRLTNEGEEVWGYYDGWRCWECWGLAVATPGLESRGKEHLGQARRRGGGTNQA